MSIIKVEGLVLQEEASLCDSHVRAFKRHGIVDSHVECYQRAKASLHDSHTTRYFEHLEETSLSSSYRVEQRSSGLRRGYRNLCAYW